ncbi:hypothetical protein KKG56_04035 [bacterium]|nr:hypothetical protein [bacterium]
MISMIALLSNIMTLIEFSHLGIEAKVVETKEFSQEQFFFKIRVSLKKKMYLQIRIYCNKGHFDYSYQLFGNMLAMRWDNKEDFPELTNYPHHYHADNGTIESSELTGEPIRDIQIILTKLKEVMNLSNY